MFSWHINKSREECLSVLVGDETMKSTKEIIPHFLLYITLSNQAYIHLTHMTYHRLLQ